MSWAGRRVTVGGAKLPWAKPFTGCPLEPQEERQGWAWLNVNGVLVACLWDLEVKGKTITATLHREEPPTSPVHASTG